MKCLNRNVLIGLIVFAIAMSVLVPSSRGALPLLFVLVCPLSMLLIMFGMSKMKSSNGSCHTEQTDPQQEIDLKNAEIARLEAMLEDQQAGEQFLTSSVSRKT